MYLITLQRSWIYKGMTYIKKLRIYTLLSIRKKWRARVGEMIKKSLGKKRLPRLFVERFNDSILLAIVDQSLFHLLSCRSNL